MRGLSPFTHEKTPSFYIHLDRQYFHCYSSGHSGDVFRFIQLKEQLTFAEAVEFLAEKYQFSLAYESGKKGESEVVSDKRVLLDIHEAVDKFFREVFHTATRDGHIARTYWTKERQFSLDAAGHHGIGVAPVHWGQTLDRLRKRFSDEALVKSGLFIRASEWDSTEIYPRFQGRLMIPIRDINGKTIAFTGRTIDGLTPQRGPANAKYINSPETPIFRKGSLFFAINLARAAVNQNNPFLLVEGQIDCLRCHECGISTAIASQGTAITAQHLHLLRRYALELVCIFDGDRAGQEAAVRMVPLALPESLNLRFVALPSGHDPDSFLRENGANALRELIQSAWSIMQVLVNYHLGNSEDISPAHREHGMRQIFKVIRETPSRVSEHDFLRQLAELTGIGMEEVKADYFRERPAISLPRSKVNEDFLCDSTGRLLQLLIMAPDYAMGIAQIVDDQWVDTSSATGRILNRFIGELLNENLPADIVQTLPTEDQDLVNALLFHGEESLNPKEEINICIGTIYNAFLKKEIAKITRSIGEKNTPDLPALIHQRQELKLALRTLPTLG
jgi:DNA primase